MNPLTNVRNINQLNENDLKHGIFDHHKTWHSQYKDSAYIFVGGLPYELTEGDILCVFSQYGEIVNLNLVRDKKTGKSCGYGFICYEDQRSTILAVDNLNSFKLGTRTIRVDHVGEYRTPKSDEKDEDGKFKLKVETGCAPKTPSPEPFLVKSSEKKKKKKEKKEKKKKKKKKRDDESDKSSSDDNDKGDTRPSETLNKERKDKPKSKPESQWDKHEQPSVRDTFSSKHLDSRERKRSRSRSREHKRSRSRSRERKRSRDRSRDHRSRDHR